MQSELEEQLRARKAKNFNKPAVINYSTVVKFVDIFKVKVIDRLPEKTSHSN